MRTRTTFLVMLGLSVLSMSVYAQDPADVLNFDETAEGPWSDIEKTTLTIPKVSSGQIQLDGAVSTGEYGGFEGIPVVPGENAWILNYASVNKDWQSPEDTSFTFYLAYDEDFLYVGLDVKDDVVRSNDPPGSFWKDDAMEIMVDPLNTRYDVNYDSTENFFGGHSYFNYQGLFSEWENDARRDAVRWSSLADWEYGEDKQVFGFGQETEGGYVTEVKMHKVMFVDPIATDFAWAEGQDMGFNIGLDDDDGEDLALQYWWANRIRAQGYNEEESWNWSEEEVENREFLNPDVSWYPFIIDANGRLTPGGMGEIILGPAGTTSIQEWSLF
ncbi:MAG: hypothetical protein JXR73_08170 [Candidatus Omnitrophica bacterium]|nr:hypothetical protein [Candidatus Omnitrophota bacterium]